MILLYRGKSPLSRAIEFFAYLRFWSDENRKYSHASWSFATIENGKLAGDLSEWESWRHGVCHVQRIGENHEPDTRVDLYELERPLDAKGIKLALEFLVAQEGKAYDWRGIVGFLFRSSVHDKRKWFCSELVFAMLKATGRIILNGLEPHQVSPGLLPLSPDLRYKGYIVCGKDLCVHSQQTRLDFVK